VTDGNGERRAFPTEATGENGLWTGTIGVEFAETMEVHFPGSGAVAELIYVVCPL
jgi:hypothetical protein